MIQIYIEIAHFLGFWIRKMRNQNEKIAFNMFLWFWFVSVYYCNFAVYDI